MIAYKPGGAAEMVANGVEQRLRNLLLDRSHLHQFSLDENKARTRPVLIITERFVDLNVVIQHQWTYRSMVHDLFGIHKNLVRVVSTA